MYLPLEQAWPDTFSDERLREDGADARRPRRRRLDAGARRRRGRSARRFVEELVYRGLLQRAFVAPASATSAAVLIVAVWFALIHFRPVEYPGLFVFGLVLGACAVATGRLGMSIAAHVAFNVTGARAWSRATVHNGGCVT